MTVTMPPDPSAAERHRAACLMRDGMRCVVCGRSKDLHAHHVIPRQVLRRELRGAPEWALENAIEDRRNGMMVCPDHDPDRTARYKLNWTDVPDQEGLRDFAEDLDLIGRLGHQFPEAAERLYAVRSSAANEGGIRMQQEVPHREAEHFTVDLPTPGFVDES